MAVAKYASIISSIVLLPLLASTAVAQAKPTKSASLRRPVQISSIDASDWLDEARDVVAGVSDNGQSIAIGAGATGKLILWSVPDGRTSVIGRTGAGPGELRSVGLLGWQESQLAVFDPALRRVSVFSGSGAFISTSATGSVAPTSFGAKPNLGLSVPFTGMSESSAGRVDSAEVGTVRDGKFIASFRLPQRLGATLDVPTAGSGLLRTQHPAGSVRDWVFSPDGVEACGTELIGPMKDRTVEFTVACRNATNLSDRWTQQARLPAVAMTRAWADSAAAAFVAQTKLPAAVRTNMSNELVKRDFVSPVERLISGNPGRILIQLRSQGVSVSVLRLDRSGAQATATFPPDSRLIAARGPWIVTARDGDDGTVQIMLWRWDG